MWLLNSILIRFFGGRVQSVRCFYVFMLVGKGRACAKCVQVTGLWRWISEVYVAI